MGNMADMIDDWDEEFESEDPPLAEIEYFKRVKETELAVQYDASDDPFRPDRFWLPKSQIVEEDMRPGGQRFVLIPQWLAEREGLV